MKFRKKPVVVDAWQWNGFNDIVFRHNVPLNCEIRLYDNDVKNRNCSLCGNMLQNHGWIKTLEGGHIVCIGDWIIKGVKGEFYPCKPDIFELTYDRVEGQCDVK